MSVSPQTAARAVGMDIATDGASVHYQGNPAQRKWGDRWGQYTPHYQLFYAQATAPRNLLFSADAEFHRFARTVDNRYQLRAKTYLLAADYHGQRAAALGLGGILRTAPRDNWPVIMQLEIFGAPEFTTFLNGRYLWGIMLQGNYPLPNNNALNLGFRKIKMGVDDVSASSFQNSLYLGLTSYF